jgi:hypothetical protein
LEQKETKETKSSRTQNQVTPRPVPGAQPGNAGN